MRLNLRENSSDLDRARELARRLREGGPIAAAGAPTVPFVRFGFTPAAAGAAPALLPAVAVAAPATAVATVAVPVEVAHSPLDELVAPGPAGASDSASVPARSWSEVLDRCLVHAHASAAMVVDATGLRIASAGDWEGRSAEQVEALGARLQVSVEQSRNIEEPCHVVAMGLSQGWLSGMRVETGAGPMALGFFAVAPTEGDSASRAAGEVVAFLAAPIEG